jgi:Txe/YoeB family toxin of Txe-Axe toxin-antitoxin module
VKVAFKNNNNLIKHINNIIKNVIKNSSFENVGIYKLKCNCNKFYTGKTNRNFKIRYKEHISEIKYNRLTQIQILLNIFKKIIILLILK